MSGLLSLPIGGLWWSDDPTALLLLMEQHYWPHWSWIAVFFFCLLPTSGFISSYTLPLLLAPSHSSVVFFSSVFLFIIFSRCCFCFKDPTGFSHCVSVTKICSRCILISSTESQEYVSEVWWWWWWWWEYLGGESAGNERGLLAFG